MDAGDIYDRFARPLVSVVIPVYNAEKYLDQCLSSLKYQTLTNFEVLCVDDGSDDQSVSIINHYVQSDFRFKFFSQTHQFAGVARNLGIKHAKGEYLLFLDADDSFVPNLLIDAYYQAKLFNAEICVFCANSFDDKHPKLQAMPWICNFSHCPKDQLFSKETNPENIYAFTTSSPWSKLFRRQFILDKKIYFQDTKNANDLRFVLTALAEADRIVALDKVLVYYRINHGTSLQQTKDSDPTCICDALTGLKIELVDRGLFEKLKKPYYSAVAGHCLYNLRTLQSRQSFECLYRRLQRFLAEDLHLAEISESFIGFMGPKDKEEFFDICRLNAEDYMCKYERFGMKKPIEEIEEQEENDQSTEDENKAVSEEIALHHKVFNYYKANGLFATCKKIISRLLKF